MDLQQTPDGAANRRRYSDEFKRDAVRLVVEEGYSFKAARQAVGVCEQTLRSWHAKLAPSPKSCGEGATPDRTSEQAPALLSCEWTTICVDGGLLF